MLITLQVQLSPDTSHIIWCLFGHWLQIPIDFFFPVIRGKITPVCWPLHCPAMWMAVGKPLKRLKCSPCQRQRDRSSTTIGKLMQFHWNPSTEGTPLCMVMSAKWARCTTTTLEQQTLEESATEEVPWSTNCLSLAQHQTGGTSLGWVNRKLCTFIQMFSRASLLDQKWKVWCRGKRCVWKSM